jgi:hypothetical protein
MALAKAQGTMQEIQRERSALRVESNDERQPHDNGPDVNREGAGGGLDVLAYQSPDRPNRDDVNAGGDCEIECCPKQ